MDRSRKRQSLRDIGRIARHGHCYFGNSHKRRCGVLVVLDLQDFQLILATTAVIHTAVAALLAVMGQQTERSQFTHAIMDVHRHPAGDQQVKGGQYEQCISFHGLYKGITRWASHKYGNVKSSDEKVPPPQWALTPKTMKQAD